MTSHPRSNLQSSACPLRPIGTFHPSPAQRAGYRSACDPHPEGMPHAPRAPHIQNGPASHEASLQEAKPPTPGPGTLCRAGMSDPVGIKKLTPQSPVSNLQPPTSNLQSPISNLQPPTSIPLHPSPSLSIPLHPSPSSASICVNLRFNSSFHLHSYSHPLFHCSLLTAHCSLLTAHSTPLPSHHPPPHPENPLPQPQRAGRARHHQANKNHQRHRR